MGRAVFESYKVDPLCQAVEQAWKAGIVVVVAAGNDGRNNTYGNNGYATIEAFGRALPALAAATRVWRDLFPDPMGLCQEGLDFIRKSTATR